MTLPVWSRTASGDQLEEGRFLSYVDVERDQKVCVIGSYLNEDMFGGDGLGQTLTVEMEGKNSQAAAETHKDVADDLADADKSMVADAWNEIGWLYAQVNAGPGVLAPLAAYEEPEDLNTRAALDEKLTKIGVVFTAEHFTENYGLKKTEFTVAAPAPTPGPGANFAAPAESAILAEKAQANLDAAIKTMLPDALKASREFVTEVENAVTSATSFDDLQDALVELLAPSMAPDALESFLARAMTAAAGHGAAAVQAEVEEDDDRMSSGRAAGAQRLPRQSQATAHPAQDVRGRVMEEDK